MRRQINLLREFSLPLLAGVVIALCWANLAPAHYHAFLRRPLWAGLDVVFLTNDLFMVFFFGIAAAEITQSCLPGGDLNPPRKAVNPILGTVGGVIGPIAVYLAAAHWLQRPEWLRGFGIPTATDIALAWLAARVVFGRRHPAISYLLLLAIVDDGIGLAIIAIFYPDPLHSVAPLWLLLSLLGMVVAWGLRRRQVASYWPYLLFGGGLSWSGLFLAHLHPALALVVIVPFLPAARQTHSHIFEEEPLDRSPLATFEHEWKVIVDFGLLLFGLANAGVEFTAVGGVTWIVLAALVLGKTAGVFLFAVLGRRLGFPLPHRVGATELFLVGLLAGVGMTVALFVAGVAFADPVLQGGAKMGALLSGGAALLAFACARLLRVRRID